MMISAEERKALGFRAKFRSERWSARMMRLRARVLGRRVGPFIGLAWAGKQHGERGQSVFLFGCLHCGGLRVLRADIAASYDTCGRGCAAFVQFNPKPKGSRCRP